MKKQAQQQRDACVAEAKAAMDRLAGMHKITTSEEYIDALEEIVQYAEASIEAAQDDIRRRDSANEDP